MHHILLHFFHVVQRKSQRSIHEIRRENNTFFYVRDDLLRNTLFLSRSVSASFSGNSLHLILSNAANIDHWVSKFPSGAVDDFLLFIFIFFLFFNGCVDSCSD